MSTLLLPLTIAGAVPQALASYYDDAVSVMSKGDLKGAINLFDDAVTQDGKNWSAFLKRGQCLYQLGDFDLAQSDFNQVVKLNKTNPDGFFWHGNASAKLGKFSVASSDYAEVVKLAPNYIADHTLPVLSASAAASGSGTASSGTTATPAPSSGTSTSTNSSGTSSSKGGKLAAFQLKSSMFGGYKDPDNQVQQLTVAISLDPLNSKLLYQRARAYIQTYKYQSALQDLSNAILSEPNNASYYLARAFVYHKEGEDAVALQDIKQAQFVDPGLPATIDFAKE